MRWPTGSTSYPSHGEWQRSHGGGRRSGPLNTAAVAGVDLQVSEGSEADWCARRMNYRRLMARLEARGRHSKPALYPRNDTDGNMLDYVCIAMGPVWEAIEAAR